uniref:Uncharacterized protein n=1 Tax=Serinus canaria TaxID=9135 RepID=A0A8C9MK08_SERCA
MWELLNRCQVLRPKSRRPFYCDLSFLKQRNKLFFFFLKEGLTVVTYQPQDEKANFFRIVFSNPASRKPDVYFLLEKVERLS